MIAYVPEGASTRPTGHMRFAGTITLPDGAFEATLESRRAASSSHGFRDIVLLGDHGGYQKSLAQGAPRGSNREWASSSPVRVHAIDEYYRAAERRLRAGAAQAQGFSDAEIGTHAGLADTSLRSRVDARAGAHRPPAATAARSAAADGVYGDPRRASAELGRLGVDADRRADRATADPRRARRRRVDASSRDPRSRD